MISYYMEEWDRDGGMGYPPSIASRADQSSPESNLCPRPSREWQAYLLSSSIRAHLCFWRQALRGKQLAPRTRSCRPNSATVALCLGSLPELRVRLSFGLLRTVLWVPKVVAHLFTPEMKSTEAQAVRAVATVAQCQRRFITPASRARSPSAFGRRTCGTVRPKTGRVGPTATNVATYNQRARSGRSF